MIDKIKEFILKPFCDMTVKEKLLDIFVIISFSLIIVFGFSSCSKLNAEEITYYDWEKVEVSELPEASDSTLDKVYVVNDKYYITNKQVSGGNNEPIPLNENLNGKTVYFDYVRFFNEYSNSSFTSGFTFLRFSNNKVISYILESYGDVIYFNNFNSTVGSYGLTNVQLFDSRYCFSLDDFDDYYSGHTNSKNGHGTYWSTCVKSFYVDRDVSVMENLVGYTYFSLTPFESTTTYSWQEVSKDLVDPFDRHLSDDDFYLFFTFEDISNFNIFSSYDFSVFTDFEKIVVVGLFNILYLGLFFGVVYIVIKLLNKGLSFIFK